MKQVIFSAIAFISVVSVQAQNKKGNLMIGTYVGSGSYYSSKYKSTYSYSPNVSESEYKSFSIGVGPEVGLYITDRLVVGTSLNISYGHSKNDYSSTGSPSTSTGKSSNVYFSAGPSARLYLGKKNDKGMPFVWLGGGIGFYPSDKATYKNENPTTYEYTYQSKNYVTWNFGPRVGYEHFLNKCFGLQYYIGYNYSHSSYKYDYDYIMGGTDYSYKTKYNSGGVTFGVGVLLHLEKK